MAESIVVDGSILEGGGQVLRCSLSLAWLIGQPIRIHSIRAGRPKPGLANQHLAAVRIASEISGFSISGDYKGSEEITVTPLPQPILQVRQPLVADAHTAGATTLILQASLPPLLFCLPPLTELVLKGGTDVPFSPPLAHTEHVLAGLLRKMGINLSVRRLASGFSSAGEVRARAEVAGGSLAPIILTERGHVHRVVIACYASEGGAVVAAEMAEHMRLLVLRTEALRGCQDQITVELETQEGIPPWEAVSPPAAALNGKGTHRCSSRGPRHSARGSPSRQISVQLAVTTDTGCILSANRLCSVRDMPEAVEGMVAREAATVVGELEALLASGACVCEHTSDQLLVFMALAKGTSRVRVPAAATRKSQHLPTAIFFAEQLTGAVFRITPDKEALPVRTELIECVGIGAELVRPRTGLAPAAPGGGTGSAPQTTQQTLSEQRME